MRQWLLGLRRRNKRILQVVADIGLICFSLWLAFVVRLGFDETQIVIKKHLWLFWAVPLATLPVFIRFGMYRAVMRYLGQEVLISIAKAVSIAALLVALVIYWRGDAIAPIPRSFVFNYWWISLLVIGGSRLVLREYFSGELFSRRSLSLLSNNKASLSRVAIYGAGSAGNQLAHALRMDKRMQPVAFIDDDDNIATRTIAGLKVYKPKHIEQMLNDTGATQVLLAMPSSPRARRREILADLEQYPVHVLSIPGFMDLASGKVKVQDLQEVDIADLLGRDAVEPNTELFKRCIADQVVLVTGAGGSIGSELCRQIVTAGVKALILYEHAEYNLYRIHHELEQVIKQQALDIRLLPIMGSIREPEHLLEVMQRWQVNTVYHAAAYKHVPLVEHNSAEGVFNNVFGTLNTAEAAIAAGVENFVLISTDKAVRPTNVMGGTKRLAEMVLQALSQEKGPLTSFSQFTLASNRTRFTMVRFGNVLGSSGSVIPLFRQQIAQGGPVTVTHPNITRYFMTIPEASQLVIQAGSMGQGGDVFVLDMGEPVRIAELAEKMINLTGLTVRNEKNPNGEIEVKFTGLRPGEKLYEELLIGDNVASTSHPMIMRANETYLAWPEFFKVLEELWQASEQGDCAKIRRLLVKYVDGYNPQGEIVDLMYLQQRQEAVLNS
ncbi:polysaccharide biosynthesis protein [Thiopseudomonas alkaliphila]|uniref:polysaccharide biosynthesis protein n=1 Tax=Thiopseudomonas alkaliphila TaxID=1697053 RepID=UPI0038B5AE66